MAIVTGAAQGLSRGMAEGLMEAGAAVCIMDINPVAEETAKEYRKKGYDVMLLSLTWEMMRQERVFFGRQSGNWEDILIFW